mmetsp:Transcript_19000/g.47201  ORF Transcript_19000/g.47201 Transcript_19000/m.47201 type:complete len:229 (-) Transcript_19000:206-892(-)
MGIASSTETKTNYITGEKKTKHKMGGSYPGNRRAANSPYSPPGSQFSNGKATSHFVSYGGGNALVLKQGGMAQPQVGAALAKPPEYIQVTLPAGVKSGQKIQVQAPDGRLNEIIIPPGFGPGSTFTVEFADVDSPPAPEMSRTTYGATPTRTTPPPPQVGNDGDDGFATGFHNPGFVPQATASSNVGASDYSSYPTATDARPVYSEPSSSSQPSSYSPNYTPNLKPYV